MDLAEGGEKFLETTKSHQDLPQSVAADIIKGMARPTEVAYKPMFCFLLCQSQRRSCL